MGAPFFSIVVPVFDRDAFIGRAIRSCLMQDFDDFEIVVVDDASRDGSVRAVDSIVDGRVRLIRHDRNRGQCPTRNTGMAAARGAWLVFLDSDDELLPGALQMMSGYAAGAPDRLGCLRFMCRDDRGTLSPDPPHRNEIWDYEGYIRWWERMRGRPSEALFCVRACTFPNVRFPDDRSCEMLYHLDLAKAFGVQACEGEARAYHYDAGNRMMAPNTQRALTDAPDAAANVIVILERHGAALREWGPGIFQDMLRAGALYSFLAGRRKQGLSFAAESLRKAPLSPRLAAIVAAGLVDRRAAAWLQGLKANFLSLTDRPQRGVPRRRAVAVGATKRVVDE